MAIDEGLRKHLMSLDLSKIPMLAPPDQMEFVARHGFGLTEEDFRAADEDPEIQAWLRGEEYVPPTSEEESEHE